MNYIDFLDVLPKWCKEALRNAPPEYKLTLKSLSSSNLESLATFLNTIDGLGVLGFGYRCFWKSGETSIFAFNSDWNDLMKIEGFNSLNLEFIANELSLIIKNKINLVTRTRDKTSNNYLLELDKTSVNNGIVLYNQSLCKIEVFYFQCLSPNDRDYLLNKTKLLQSLIDGCKPILRSLVDSKEMNLFKTPCLSKEQKLVCFSSGYLKNTTALNGVNVTINGINIELSSIDIECLFFLKFGGSVTQIAQCVGRSPSAIKDRIQSLKAKFNIHTKDELTSIARNDLAFLTKDLGYINNIGVN